MAYLTLLGSVDVDQVERFRAGTLEALRPGLLVRSSHILTSWVRPKRLRELLGLAFDGGEILRSDLWHPLRAPCWHDPKTLEQINQELSTEWKRLLRDNGEPSPVDWYSIEISQVLGVFEHAVTNGNGIVSVLCPPFDKQRADKVLIPLETESGCPQTSPEVSK